MQVNTENHPTVSSPVSVRDAGSNPAIGEPKKQLVLHWFWERASVTLPLLWIGRSELKITSARPIGARGTHVFNNNNNATNLASTVGTMYERKESGGHDLITRRYILKTSIGTTMHHRDTKRREIYSGL